ncbi:LysR family transcriptional regulator, partial [Ancylobacter sp. VNQ12]|uniref:LysR family transcriptional regulator n=1 Tax=Ancylobacter sp. VNQ12 TaxID=3400920 RepID=UPI003C109C95
YCPLAVQECAYEDGAMHGFDWGDLRFFLTVARAGRLTLAARQLRVDHATVSRRLAALEAVLKTKLFERYPQGYRLTEAGDRLMVAAETIESTAIEAESAISGTNSALSGTVRIGAPDGFGTYFLARRLGPLLARHPLLTIQLVPLPRVFSLAKREADLVITIDPPDTGRLHLQKLTDYTLGLYASAEYLDRHGPIADVSELRSHRIVCYVADLMFSSSLNYLSELGIPDSLRFECASVIGQMEATMAGIGIGVLHDYVAQSHPALHKVLPHKVKRTYWIVAHDDVRTIARMNYVREFIINAVVAEKFLY